MPRIGCRRYLPGRGIATVRTGGVRPSSPVPRRYVSGGAGSRVRGKPVRTRPVAALVGFLVVLAGAAVPAGSPAVAEDGGGAPWVVSLGDSYISGEAGRWAGSSNESTSYADALGPTAYYDNPAGTGETIEGCHRSKSAEIYLGGSVSGLNLACSGAATTTSTSSDGDFKPGLDFFDDGAGRLGQAALLETFAATQDVDLVVVSIGGNDFEFADVVQTCILNFLTSPEFWPNYCSDDDEVEALFADDHRALVQSKIVTGLRNVRTAMRGAGYGDRDWTLLVQTYPSPIPRGSGFRYSQSGYVRQEVGGCGFWNRDADWANDTALPVINETVKKAVRKSRLVNTKVLDLSHAFDGRRLCESTVGLYEEVGLTSWTQPGAVDRTEWINQVRTLTGLFPPYQLQEGLHPNYWAQLATRSCLRQAYGDGDVRGGTCRIKGTGLVDGEPRMKLR